VATPPYRIETDRLVIRCWQPSDAPLLKDAVDTSLEHLRPWMPWAHDDPQPVENKMELLRGFRSRFDAGDDFVYGIFSRDESEAVGGTGLHPRVGDDAFEIGYWIRSSAVGKGLATETAAALTRVAFDLAAVERVELHVDPANEASCRVARKLGYGEEARLRRRLPDVVPNGPKRDEIIFSMFAEEFADSAAGAISRDVAAFDALGRSLH
jgi:RimJ/RimL family protein N-acetyltransferase